MSKTRSIVFVLLAVVGVTLFAFAMGPTAVITNTSLNCSFDGFCAGDDCSVSNTDGFKMMSDGSGIYTQLKVLEKTVPVTHSRVGDLSTYRYSDEMGVYTVMLKDALTFEFFFEASSTNALEIDASGIGTCGTHQEL